MLKTPRAGAGDNQFGVKRGDLRILANKIKTNHELALSLWKTGNIDAQFLATLLIKVSLLSADEMDRMVGSRHLCVGGRLAPLLCRQGARR